MKTLTIIAAFLVAAIATAQFNTGLIPSASVNSSTDYIFIKYNLDNGYYISINALAEVWSSGGKPYKEFSGFEDSLNTYTMEDVKYEQLHYANSSYSTTSLFEVRDTNSTAAIGFLYIGPQYNTGDTLSKAAFDLAQELMDTVNVHHNSSDALPFTSGSDLKLQKVYPISFTQDDPYNSTYSLSELAYQVYYDNAGDKLEFIQDTDRSNKLVGFRYTSDLNGKTYSVFIEPDN